MYKRSPNKIFR